MASNRTIVTYGGRSRDRWDSKVRGALGSASSRPVGARAASRLNETAAFGTNPGALRMLSYAPPTLTAGSPLVVVLHGCTQNAAGYDSHAPWTNLADEFEFAVLYPEQRAANNPNGCFNWFLAADKSRGLGEARSISEMVETMAKRHGTDRGRIFVTGLSAGGAMAAALLADYPEVFSAGAIIAGLPCGAASSVQEAFSAMGRPAERSASELGDAVRAGSTHRGPWPRVAIWHGAADTTVAPRNADELVKQWLDVHGVPLSDFQEEFFEGHRRRVWSAGGRDVVESVMVAGMGHGTPLDSRLGERKGPFMLDARVSSTRRIAAFFGLGVSEPKTADKPAEPRQASAEAAKVSSSAEPGEKPPLAGENLRGAADGKRESADRQTRGARLDIGAVITKALRSAGLMK